MSKEQLKPCPWCGGKDITIEYCDEGCCYNVRIIYCECGAELWMDDPIKDAIKKWNTRAGEEK